MSLNKFMHPRNIYKVPPDFTSLAVAYPEFLAVSTVGLNGKVQIDFKNQQTLRSLTRCLLLKDFGLDVELPPEKLVPTLPLRLNYILWLEDIFLDLELSNIRGIDIGCGASCIYPLLAAKSKNWKMYALDVDETSVSTAQQNVHRNKLDDNITVLHQTSENEIFYTVFQQPDVPKIDFCMCNPPFYDLEDTTVSKNRSGERAKPKNARTGIFGELAVEGGEIKFVQKIIQESLNLKDKIQVYTTMLGHKSSLKVVVDLLKQHNIQYIATTEFCQGRTMRWGVAWSFVSPLNIPRAQTTSKRPHTDNLLAYSLPSITVSLPLTLSTAVVRVKEIFGQLKIELKLVKSVEDMSEIFEFAAYENTWSHQRRKRREVVKLPLFQNKINQEIEQGSHSEKTVEHPEFSVAKRIKLENPATPILEGLICLENQEMEVEEGQEEDNEIVLKISFQRGIFGKDGVNQILQFLKNNWKLRE